MNEDIEYAKMSLEEEEEAMNAYIERIEGCDNEELKKILSHLLGEETSHANMLKAWLELHSEDYPRGKKEAETHGPEGGDYK